MISVELKGRFGNHLFQYALCRIVAEKNNYNFCIPNGDFLGVNSVYGGWLGRKLFKCSHGLKYERQSNSFNEGNVFSEDVFNIPDSTHLNGYWQSPKYFKGYEEKIRKWYHIEKPESEYINSDYCVIHLRAQDGYLRDNYVLPKLYFDTAKSYIKKINPHIKFVVVTDNLDMAKHYFSGDIIIKNDMKLDFQILLYSKYKIISNSSFSWWASWLGIPNSEIIIAPDRWMNYNFNKHKEDKFYPYDIKTKEFIYL